MAFMKSERSLRTSHQCQPFLPRPAFGVHLQRLIQERSQSAFKLACEEAFTMQCRQSLLFLVGDSGPSTTAGTCCSAGLRESGSRIPAWFPPPRAVGTSVLLLLASLVRSTWDRAPGKIFLCREPYCIDHCTVLLIQNYFFYFIYILFYKFFFIFLLIK